MTEAALPPGKLVERLAERSRTSLATGARTPIRSRVETVEEGGIGYLVRLLDLGAVVPGAEPHAAGVAGARRSPFLPPYDPDLLVGALPPSHVCLLNKYNVVERHLLIVTREYEPQESALSPADFRAAAFCLHELDGLVFYNSGADAGASQAHKHLQLVPFPLGPGTLEFPLAAAVGAALRAASERVHELELRHLLLPLEPAAAASSGAAPPELAALAARRYRQALERLGLEPAGGGPPAPYNLLMTRRFLLVVPRRCGASDGVEVNALGFAGALAARSEDGLARVRRLGPRRILREVALPP